MQGSAFLPPPPPIRFAAARVQAVTVNTAHWQELLVCRDDPGPAGAAVERAFHDAAVWGPLAAGDPVVLNTTAADLGLGTGGYHFVAWVSGRHPPAFPGRDQGHIMKLRYTPLQRRVLAVEETAHPLHTTLQGRDQLDGMPVLVGGLHSQLAPAAAGLRYVLGDAARLVYVMTDAGALPAGFSHVLRRLRADGRLDAVITAGHAYGGDLEAVHPLSALLAARHGLRADAALVMPGPGIVGTGHPLATTALEQAALLDLAAAAGGRSLAVLRVSFADRRPRHRGISHHTLTTLGLTARSSLLPVPRLPVPQADQLWSLLADHGHLARHFALTVDSAAALPLLAQWLPGAETMGRTAAADGAFFLAAAAAGVAAANLIQLCRSAPRGQD